MKKYLLGDKNFYKANLHTHTTASDGLLSPEEIKSHYIKNGYSVVAFTDHNLLIPHHDLTDEKFLALTAMEGQIDSKNYFTHPYDFVDAYHLNFYAKSPNFNVSIAFSPKHLDNTGKGEYIPYPTLENLEVWDFPVRYDIKSVNDCIRWAREKGFFVSYNHPVWSGHNYPDYIDLNGVWGVEVWNTGSNKGGYSENDQAFEDFLRAGKTVFPLASDDCHSYNSACGGWVMIQADKLDYATIISALETGDFYASTAPAILALTVENGILEIRCSPAEKIIVSCERRKIWQEKADGEPITSASFDLNGYLSQTKKSETLQGGLPRKPFIRVRVYDENGVAYTRAYNIEELL